MSLTRPSTETTEPPAASPRPRSRWTGRSELLLVALLYVLAVLLTVGTVTMHVLGKASPGPQFFPILVCVLLYAAATALAVQVLRHPSQPDTEPHPGHGDFSADMLSDLGRVSGERTAARGTGTSGQWRMHSDWKTVGQVAGAAVLFIAVLNVVGWILSATFLFWTVARALGSRRPLLDLGIALLFSSVIQLAFDAGLGLPLPPGFLEGTL